MTIKVAQRGNVPAFVVMDVMRAAFERQQAKGDVLHLEVGQPSTPAPQGVIAAAKAALDTAVLGYTDAMGIPQLRARIAEHYQSWYGIEVPVERIAVTTGSSGAFVLAFLAAFDPGDRVAVAEPGYPCYRNILSALGVEPVPIVTTEASRFQPTIEMLEAAPGRLDGLIVASPSNPAGTMLSAVELEALANYCAERGIRLISDEIYHGITYGGRAATALQFTERAVIVNSFSKYFSMTGWRLGWAILPEELTRAVERLAQNLYISPPSLSQQAALAAFDCHDELRGNVERYTANRALLLEQLPLAGFERLAPAQGAFYIYADVAGLTNDAEAFCRRMLAETGVAATPGVDFDPGRGHGFVRFSFAGATRDMAEAAERLKAWLA
ncbi:MAG: pyridoxal phosphate-dependent aminotransferase [Alphaproteobacteria bacterium]